jgi:hypothetical protein
MTTFSLAAASLASILSALALYAGSGHCRWPALQGRGGAGWLGLALAGGSLWAWVDALGVGAGLCAMLGTWMLAMMLFPLLGVLVGPQPASTRGEG